MAVIYPKQQPCAAESEPVHFPLEWNLKAQKSHKKLGSHKVSNQILPIQEWCQLNFIKLCALVFFPQYLQMNHLCSYNKHRERTMNKNSTYPTPLVSNNHKQIHLDAFCWGWEMIFCSFLIHFGFPLDLIDADYSLISILFLVTPIDCINWAWGLSGCCHRERSHVLVDIGLVTCHLLRSEAYSVPTCRYSREQWTEHKI